MSFIEKFGKASPATITDHEDVSAEAPPKVTKTHEP